MRTFYQTLKTSRLAQAFTLLAAGVVVGSAVVVTLSDPYPPLSATGQEMKADIVERLTRQGTAQDRSVDCAAHYIAHQQSERGPLRDEFSRQSDAAGIPRAETDRIIGLDKQKDMSYALYVLMACRTGQRPALFDPAVF